MFKVIKLIVSDWKRYTMLHKKMNLFLLIVVLLRNPGMYFSIVYRVERYLLLHKFFPFKLLGFLLYPGYFIFTYYILDIDISPKVSIGKSLYVHNRGIIFTEKVIAGNNLTLIGPIILGTKGLGIVDSADAPNLGNNVTIFTGARIIGGVRIGNNVFVGANAVVVKNVSSNSIVGGIPAKLIRKYK